VWLAVLSLSAGELTDVAARASLTANERRAWESKVRSEMTQSKKERSVTLVPLLSFVARLAHVVFIPKTARSTSRKCRRRGRLTQWSGGREPRFDLLAVADLFGSAAP
jgi:hypothetical protein